MSIIVRSLLAVPALLAGLSAAQAGGQGCANCYEKVVHPPQYQTRAETVLISPQRSFAHTTPAEYATVHEKVLVAPARKEWQVTIDAYGRKIGCWVMVPAQYAVQARHVMVRPAQVHHQVIPAQYATQHRVEMVAPATASWQPIERGYGHGHRRYY